MEWLKNLAHFKDEFIAEHGVPFYRMWEYYLNASAASFRSRKNHLWQVVYTKPVKLGLYETVR
jgi:cyclopropane-fatty-acyl-phospholipid synthase